MLYHEKMKALIAGWRSVFNKPELPFYYVQLAPFRYGRDDDPRLPGIWQAQLETLKVPHTGMAVTTDITNVRDIHPKNKQDVGKRLALWALVKDYGKKLKTQYSGLFLRKHLTLRVKIASQFILRNWVIIITASKPMTINPSVILKLPVKMENGIQLRRQSFTETI